MAGPIEVESLIVVVTLEAQIAAEDKAKYMKEEEEAELVDLVVSTSGDSAVAAVVAKA
jgi:hypothetical protein